jgi:outer membrane protein TolC
MNKEYAMKKLKALCALSVLLCGFVLPLAAQNTVSLEMAREKGLEKSAAVKKYSRALENAVLVRQAQVYAGLPSFAATGSAAYDTDTSVSAGVSATATVFDGGKNGALVKKYDYAVQSAQENLKAGRIAVIDAVDTAFFAVLEKSASYEAARDDLAAAQQRLEIAQIKTASGVLSRADLLETESEIASYQSALDTARTAYASAKIKLTSVTGIAGAAELQSVLLDRYAVVLQKLGTADDQAVAAVITSLSDRARKNSPSYTVYALAQAQSAQALSAARSSCLPTVSAVASGKLNSGSGSPLEPAASITVSASVDLDFLTLKNAVKQAQNALDQSELDSVEQGESLDLAVSQAVYSVLSAALALPSSEKALSYAKINYEQVLEKYKLSSATGSDVSTALALVSTDQNNLIAARYAFLQGLSTLRSLTGGESEDEVTALLNELP